MDKFGRPLQRASGAVNSAQVVIPQDFVRLDGTLSMQANLDIGGNEIHNVSTMKGVGKINVDSSLDMKTHSIDNVQSLSASASASGNSTIKFNDPVEMSGNIDMGNQYEVVNTKFNGSSNALVPRYVVDNNYHALEDTFDKGTTSIIPVTGQIVTASSSAGNMYKPEYVFDGKTNTQWAIAKTDLNPWIGVKFPNAIKLWKITLHPRLGNQKGTHIITSSSLHGSNDGVNWVKIMESNEHINKIVQIEFQITRPYSYFKLEAQGNLQFGLSLMEMFEAKIKEVTLDPNITRYETLANFVPYPFKCVPALGYNPSTKENVITNSAFTVPFGGASSQFDIVNKLYVDNLTNLVSGGGINRVQNGLQLDSNVYLHSSTLAANWTKYLPVAGTSTVNNSTYNRITDSGFTVPDLNQRPSLNTDVVDKLYVDSTFISKSIFDINNALPGVPVTSGISMAFIPTLKTCYVTTTGQINTITDPLTSLILGSTGALRPEFKIDADGIYYLEFSNHRISKDGVSVADLGGPNGNTTTFFLIIKQKMIKNQNNFNWVKEIAPNTYDYAVRLGVHIPWSNSNVYVDYAKVSTGRVFGTYTGTLNQKQVWSYRRNGAWGQILLNNSEQYASNSLSSSFTQGDVGRFMIGNGNSLTENAVMDFYGLFFYNRNLNNDEMKQMDLYIRNYFKI